MTPELTTNDENLESTIAGIAIGGGMAVALGVAMDDFALGTALGMGFGVTLGVALADEAGE